MIPFDDLKDLGVAVATAIVVVVAAVILGIVGLHVSGDGLIIAAPVIAVAFVAAIALTLVRAGTGE